MQLKKKSYLNVCDKNGLKNAYFLLRGSSPVSPNAHCLCFLCTAELNKQKLRSI